jgi:hypothetical protein
LAAPRRRILGAEGELTHPPEHGPPGYDPVGAQVGTVRAGTAAMNPWLDRFAAGLDGVPLTVDREEAALILELAGAAARSSGARQFAPLATWLAGRGAAAADRETRLALLRRACAAAAAAGAAEEPLRTD